MLDACNSACSHVPRCLYSMLFEKKSTQRVCTCAAETIGTSNVLVVAVQ
jgi:hypothetical protein